MNRGVTRIEFHPTPVQRQTISKSEKKTWVSLWDYGSWFYIVKRKEGGKRLDYLGCFLQEIGLLFLKPAEPNQTQIAGTSPLGESWGIFFNLDVRPKSFHTPLIPKNPLMCVRRHTREEGRWFLLRKCWVVTSNPGGFIVFRTLWGISATNMWFFNSHLILRGELLDSISLLSCALYISQCSGRGGAAR